MGKVRRARQKLHASTMLETPQTQNSSSLSSESKSPLPIVIEPGNIFTGINIDLDALNKNVKQDDTVSVKSFKSAKSEKSEGKSMTKKDKLKLRRDILLKKIDTVNQLKKERQRRKKRENDTNPLHDALPSLESLLKPKDNSGQGPRPVKAKSIQKSSKRKKDLLRGISIYKKLLQNKELNKNPFGFASERVKQIAQYNDTK